MSVPAAPGRRQPAGTQSATDLCHRRRSAGADPDAVIRAVRAGARTIDRAWHQLRDSGATLRQWQDFAAVCRQQGRSRYSVRWALHQYRCWTERSNAGTYPQQRAEWAARQQQFAADMAARRRPAASPACEASPEPQPPAEPDHTQLGLF